MDASIQRIVLLSVLGYTGYIIATCPCEQMGVCKKEQFIVLTSIPMAFALYNFLGEEKSCSLNK
jgi:hypothetical protein